MKKFILCVIAFVFANCTIAQPNTFEKIIDSLGCVEAKCVKETYDGGYIVCGGSFYNNNDAAIIKLDSLGNIQWVKLYGGGGMDAILRIEQLPDSGYIAMGIWNAGLSQKTWLLRMNKNGDTLWTNKISGGNYKNEPTGFTSQAGFNFAITGYVHVQGFNGHAYLLVTDSIGGIFVYKEYGDTSYADGGLDIITSYNGNFAITGINGTSSFNGGAYLIKTDSVGDTIFTRTYFNSRLNGGYAIKQTPDSGFIIAGFTYDSLIMTYHPYLIRANSSGDTIFTHVFYYSLGSTVKSLDIVDSTGYIITGRIINPIPQLAGNLLLIRANEYGDTLWTRWYSGKGSAQGEYVVSTKDKGFICCGFTGLAFYIIKTDSLGLVYTSIGINDAVVKPDMVIYPNPGDGLFHMKVNNIYSSFTVAVSNAMGDTIKSETIHSCDDYCLLDLSAFSNGLYTVTVQSERKSVSKKVIVLK